MEVEVLHVLIWRGEGGVVWCGRCLRLKPCEKTRVVVVVDVVVVVRAVGRHWWRALRLSLPLPVRELRGTSRACL